MVPGKDYQRKLSSKIKSFNKFRYVRYEDDGVNLYQCLKCKAYFALRYGLGPFCSLCGTRWDGQHPTKDPEEKFYLPRAKADRVWAIQGRLKDWFQGEGWSEVNQWEDDAVLNTFRFNAKQVKEWLVRNRHDKDHMEWRAVLRAPKDEQEARMSY